MPTGAIPVASAAGATISGLTIGTAYIIRNTGGPWYASGSTQPHYFYDLSADGSTWYGPIADGGATIPPWATGVASDDAQHSVVSFVSPAASVRIRVHDDPSFFADNGGAMGYDLEAGLGYCPYGSSVSPDTPFIIYLVPTILTGIVGALTEGWAWPIIAAIAGSSLDVQALCSQPPPPPVTWTADDLVTLAQFPWNPDSIPLLGKAYQWIRSLAWPKYCICNPGSPAPPTVVTPTPQPAPTGSQPQVVLACDDSSLCDILTLIQHQLNQMQIQQKITGQLVTIIQRQGVPFAYVPGTLHSGLTGQGEFDVSDILGLSVNCTTVPGYVGRSEDLPQDFYNLGDVTGGTLQGWQHNWLLKKNPELILGISATVTKIAYTLRPGVVADILELVREPDG